jgi:hypothetical protein
MKSGSMKSIALESLDSYWVVCMKLIPLRYIEALRVRLAPLRGLQWNWQEGWYMPKDAEHRKLLQDIFGPEGIEIRTVPKPAGKNAREAVSQVSQTSAQFMAITQTWEKLVIKRYSPSTIRTYKACLALLFRHFPDKDPDAIWDEEIKSYVLDGIKSNVCKESTQNSHVNAIKFYFEKVMGRPRMVFDIRAQGRGTAWCIQFGGGRKVVSGGHQPEASVNPYDGLQCWAEGE